MRWTVKPEPEVQTIQELQQSLGVPELIAKLLVQRGITSYEAAKAFFRPQLSALHNPFLMKDMDKAVVRIQQAIANGERIMVYGDYDVDGTTSVALMRSYIESIYPLVTSYIPDRYKEGYGVSYAGIDFASDNDVTLIIALDCGIKAIEKVAYAKTLGIDFIICDHHRPGNTIPEAVAVLDPKREDCTYPYDELCGCGVGFKLIQALEQENGNGVEVLLPYLDLVATAIVADIVPITGENRILCYYGLQQINTNPRPGIKALIKQLNKPVLNVTDVVFVIAPRINAAGRMKHGLHAVELLTETNELIAENAAASIETFNKDRKDLDAQITQEALAQITTNKEEEHFTTVVFQEDWHKGVIGIVASRLTETYYRPTLVFTKSGEKLAASARSVKGFDVYNALEACQDTIEQFGGHKYAAGLTMLPEQYEAFKAQFEAEVKNTIPKQLLTPEITIDAVIDFEEVNAKTYRILKQFAPFGPGNMSPVFMTGNAIDSGMSKTVGANHEHLRIVLQNGHETLVGIGFGLGAKLDIVQSGKPFQVAYAIDENTWNSVTTLQLKLKDVKA